MHLTLNLALTALLSFCVVSFASADQGGIEFTHCLGGTPQSMKHGEGNVAHIVAMNGNIRNSAPNGMLDNTSTQCLVLNGALNAVMFAHGICEVTDLDGDRLWFEFERKNSEGTFHSVAGTGKYQAFSVEGTYAHTRFPQRSGYFQACALSKGQWRKS